jgi:ABC-2 type transport system permease protein
MDRKALKRNHILQLLLAVFLVFAINYLGDIKFFRLDLTSEKKFTLAKSTREILKNLDDIVLVRVYLDGELPGDMIQFRQSIDELLNEFGAYGGNKLEVEFVNLYDEADAKVRDQAMQNLVQKGLKPTDVHLRDDQGAVTNKLVFPGALISYKGLEFPVNLLKNNPALSYQVNLNNSAESLEYEFIRALAALTSPHIDKIAFIRGHGELDFYQTYDIGKELSLFFDVKWERIDGHLDTLMNYKAIIVAQPLRSFSAADKFVIDQYIMRGGKALFFLDPVQTNEDSLSTGRTFTSFLDLNIYDLLFKYGFRIDYNLIKDLQCNYIKVETSVAGQDPGISVLPWWYFPVISAPDNHFLTKGLNYIKGEFVSAIDTTTNENPDLKRTVLLSSSDSSALITNPVYISMDEVVRPPDRRAFNKSHIPIAVLAEGKFPSFYKNYGVPDGVFPKDIQVLGESLPTSIFVAGDGDMIRNEVNVRNNSPEPYPLGYDQDTRQTYGNKEFIMNVINYMTDDRSLISLRSREFKLRLLDRNKIKTKSGKIKWKTINVLLPVLLVLAFASIFSFIRRKKYGN